MAGGGVWLRGGGSGCLGRRLSPGGGGCLCGEGVVSGGGGLSPGGGACLCGEESVSRRRGVSPQRPEQKKVVGRERGGEKLEVNIHVTFCCGSVLFTDW